MALVVKADLEACQGYANCVVGAEDVFDINDDGVVVLLRTTVSETDRARVEEAARSCPVSALRVESSGQELR
jgi:ferredoxin